MNFIEQRNKLFEEWFGTSEGIVNTWVDDNFLPHQRIAQHIYKRTDYVNERKAIHFIYYQKYIVGGCVVVQQTGMPDTFFFLSKDLQSILDGIMSEINEY